MDNGLSSCDWGSAKEQDILLYKNLLDDLLNFVDIPVDLVDCQDVFCDRHTDCINTIFERIIECITLAAEIAIPKYKNKPVFHGWNRYIRYFREKSIYWHIIWKQAGFPNEGHIADIRRLARKKYHDAIKWVKINSDKLLREKIAQTLYDSSNKLFWKEIKKINPDYKSKTNVLDGNIGKENIACRLRDKYKQLYCEFNEDNYDEVFGKICDSISSKCLMGNCCCSHEIHSDDIYKAIREIKSNKFDPIYQISSNCIKNSTSNLVEYFCFVFNKMLMHGVSNFNINKSVIISQ